MGKAILSLLVICFFAFDITCQGQTSVEVSNPILEVKDGLLHISYDLLNSDRSDQFEVGVTIKDEDGNQIIAKAFKGDIGGVEGGSNKHIIWDPGADQVFLNSKIYIKIDARLISSQETVPEPEREIVPGDQSEPTGGTNSYSRTGIILQSAIFPGWGLSRITGNPHWLTGVASYGCIAGSYLMNRRALDTYEGIDELTEFDEKNNLYQEAKNQDIISKTLGFTALGLVITDMLWTVIKTSGLTSAEWFEENLSVSLATYVDPLNIAPMVSVKYMF